MNVFGFDFGGFILGTIILSLVVPLVITGVVIGVIVTEMLASLGGIGFLISYHRTLFNTGHVYFGMALALLMAVAVNMALTSIERRVGLWRMREQNS